LGIVSLTPALRVGGSQIDRGEGLTVTRRRDGADVARGDPMHGVLVGRHLGSAIFQLTAKSYRPRSGGQRGLVQLGEAPAELRRGADPGAPETLPGAGVGGGEGLAPASIEDG
jgi:hypothetical protein